jgi:Ca2+:H+ antiporter
VSPSTAPSPSQPNPLIDVCRTLLREPLYWLLAAIPVAIVLRATSANPLWVFLMAGVAIIPLAGLMGRATENLAVTMGAGLGGLLNATFGNAAELIIALMALRRGPQMYGLVKASLTGSIIGNILLVLGLSLLAGGLKFDRQRFNATAASLGATLLALAATGLIVPSIYYYVFLAESTLRGSPDQSLSLLSEEIAIVLALTYVLSLVFSLKTHRHLFAGDETTAEEEHHAPEWSRRTAITVLLVATIGVAVMSELLVGSVESACESLGMTPVFVGVIVVAIVGNAAEHSTAVLVAMKNKMDLSVNIAIGSGIQIALFVAPVLVLASVLMGHQPPLDLHFSLMETIAVVISIAILARVAADGESHWMEGVMLLAVYVVIGLAFYHLPTPPEMAHGH